MPTRDLSGDFTAFADQRLPQLVRIARALTGSRDAADDLIQTALEKAYRSWRKVASQTQDQKFAYTRRILVNSAYDAWRRKNRHRAHWGQQVDGEDRPTEEHGPESLAVAAANVDALLAPLTPRERQVIVLRCLADLSEAETARELGIALGTVKSTAARALAKLRSSVPTPIGL
ncbi:MAG: SigE family RNA polymerase sigma factor [Propionibacteriaceae bacterium]|nr:SigE family RNA polymerase sigma factor [Propionibacteriaceae bacterium]